MKREPCKKCLCEEAAVEFLGIDREHIYWQDPYDREVEAPLGHEWAQKRFTVKDQTWTVTLLRCRGCSALSNEIIIEDSNASNDTGGEQSQAS